MNHPHRTLVPRLATIPALSIALLACLLVQRPDAARAVDYSWSNVAGGTFLDPLNWSPNGIPTQPGDVAIFSIPGTFTVDTQPIGTIGTLINCAAASNSTPVSLGRWLVHTSDVTLVLCAGASALGTDATDASVTVGNGGKLTVAGTTFNSVNTIIGNVAGNLATAVLTNPEAHWVSSGDLLVGKASPGELQVLNGGLISTSTLTIGDVTPISTVTVNGRPSADRPSEIAASGAILVGRTGLGRLAILGGGKVSTPASVLCGIATPGTSEINITGGADILGTFYPSTLSVGGLLVISSQATVLIDEGGILNAPSLSGPVESAGNAHIQVRGGTDHASTLELTGALLLGNSVQASQSLLEVQSGGKVKAASITLGSDVGGTTNATIDGCCWAGNPRGSLLEASGPLVIGAKAASILTVSNGSQASAASIKVGDASAGELKLVGPAAPRVVATGDITVGTLGQISGTGDVVASQLINNGVLSPDTINLTGNFVQNASGKLVIEVSDLAGGVFDKLNVTGTVALNGTVEFRFVNGFTLQPGDIVTFATGQTFTGTPQVSGLNVAGDGSTSPVQLPTGTSVVLGSGTGTLRVPPSESTWYQDADGDGFGNVNVLTQSATQPAGFVADNSDCNDTNANVRPGAAEVCGNDIDENCDGLAAACTGTWYRDADGDGYGDLANTTQAVEQPAGYVFDSQDCDDTNAAIHPNAAETCGNGIDEDCDGLDEACPTDPTSCGGCGAGVIPLAPLMMLTLVPARWMRRRKAS